LDRRAELIYCDDVIRILTTPARRCIALLALAVAGTASARTDMPWDGFYFGGNVGDASISSCNGWALNGAMIDPAIASQSCSKNGALVGGIQFGKTFQTKRLVWGIGADLDFLSAKSLNQSVKDSGAVPAAGTFVYSSQPGPRGFAVLGPRIGYAGDTWLPYVRVGTIIALGSHDSRLFYTPAAGTSSTASFGGGSDFSTAGWVAGGGFELGLNGAWSIAAEYLHANLGKGANSAARCSGLVAACAGFSGISFDNTHEGVSANIFRVGISYWFGYW
jgi:opacity protein-like surface antigen